MGALQHQGRPWRDHTYIVSPQRRQAPCDLLSSSLTETRRWPAEERGEELVACDLDPWQRPSTGAWRLPCRCSWKGLPGSMRAKCTRPYHRQQKRSVQAHNAPDDPLLHSHHHQKGRSRTIAWQRHFHSDLGATRM